MIATTLINALDATSVDLVMHYLPDNTWLYHEAKAAVIEEFGSKDCLYMRKNAFDKISFRRGETLPKFAARFYHEAQVLLGLETIGKVYAPRAMDQEVRPYQELYRQMMPILNKRSNTLEIVKYLWMCAVTFEPPNNRGYLSEKEQAKIPP